MGAIAGTAGEPQSIKQGGSTGMAFGGRCAGINRRHLDVLLGRARGNQVVALEHETEGFTA
ncbi:hypothetical protein D3C80_2175530 [compost metagenome]